MRFSVPGCNLHPRWYSIHHASMICKSCDANTMMRCLINRRLCATGINWPPSHNATVTIAGIGVSTQNQLHTGVSDVNRDLCTHRLTATSGLALPHSVRLYCNIGASYTVGLSYSAGKTGTTSSFPRIRSLHGTARAGGIRRECTSCGWARGLVWCLFA